ncbi:hypothetical protein BpHYR1_017763 [Brachionus plicatilis]|uniref:Uncharacterized protein n=1 Tax=Brachionus plicatilis TaxID=10195 RepID=A0A3M7S6K6_BRAPC|nr:hypothetical protein BpHYR1_017763 [Brachionus plicatilis]
MISFFSFFMSINFCTQICRKESARSPSDLPVNNCKIDRYKNNLNYNTFYKNQLLRSISMNIFIFTNRRIDLYH